MEGIYYLHENGELIYKPDVEQAANIRESDFAKSMWFFDSTDREGVWSLLVEALSLCANRERIEELAKKWRCDDNDGHVYADRLGLVTKMDGNQWCVHELNFTNLQECPAGFGDTVLEALADYCAAIGYKGGKMWNATFKDLCNNNEWGQLNA